MRSRWDDSEAARYEGDPVALRAYSSRLLGVEPTLVMHGGGNTSVKVDDADFFGDPVEVLYVKGSGWNLDTIEPPGFAPVRLDVLKRLAERESLTDAEMVRVQRSAMLNPDAPNPSVEAILHAVLPQRFVDHTHADAVVTITNSPGGEDRVRELFGERVIVVPYVMPGFVLAREVARRVRGVDWDGVEGMILLHHGVFTFGETAREAYERMIALVTEAEAYLQEHDAWDVGVRGESGKDAVGLARLRRKVSEVRGRPVVARLDRSPLAAGFAARSDIEAIATRGPITPDHVIRTKRVPAILGDDPATDIARFATEYVRYFERHAAGGLTMLDPAPRWGVWPGRGVVTFGDTAAAADIVSDIARHTALAIQRGEALGGWTALPERDLFDMEYWELEQAKLKRGKARPPLAGRVALVTGAASGIGAAVADALLAAGAAVAALDLREDVAARYDGPAALGVRCDVTDTAQVEAAVEACALAFGGVDMLVSNAGTFPESVPLEALDDERWRATLDVNLSGHQRVLRAATPLLTEGVDPAVVIVGSKNVPAPGPGVAAYSVAKAGLTQLARVAALELGDRGVRVNVVHPNAVFDTGLWNDAMIAQRASHYGVAPEDYKTRNVLHTEVTSADVARLVLAMLGPAFRCTTGAQVPIDGGNDRVI